MHILDPGLSLVVAIAGQAVPAPPPSAAPMAAAPSVAAVVPPAAPAATVTYNYDSLGRLILEVYPANRQSFTYDAAGNRTQAVTQ